MASTVTAAYTNSDEKGQEFVLTSAEVKDNKGLVGELEAMQKSLNTKLTELLEAEKASKDPANGSDQNGNQRKRQKSE
ncbi:hypothetical protein GGI12_002757 [Dipsacomyces acuminosporus]|nr:hypothetical protein GGI12_002757 [Dipsacomyces acuminosporus]